MQHNFLQTLFSLDGKVALVTGASSGIGCHMAKTLASAGAHVILVARRHSKLHEIAQHIEKKGGSAAICPANLLELNEIDRLYEDALIPFGNPDILVNAAGVNFREAPEKISWDSWNKTLMINLSVPFFLAKGFVSGMREKKSGRIINIASLQSFRAFQNGAAYGATKGGIAQLTRAMAEAWSSDGICANAIAPGFFPTELTAPVFNNKKLIEHHAGRTALGRNGQLKDLDGITIFLCSTSSDYITGQVIPVDGGYTAK